MGGEGDEFDDEDVVEVDEEELREEWVARGLDPDAFDPFTLLQIWEKEDQEVCVCVRVCFFLCARTFECVFSLSPPPRYPVRQ